MREIKFRLWNKYSSFMCKLDGKVPFGGDWFKNTNGLYIPYDKNLMIMQYIGMQDKKKKDIYEDDILKTYDVHDEKFIFVVKFECLLGEESDRKICDGGMGFNTYNYCSDELQIIGNIYQNPELLEKIDET